MTDKLELKPGWFDITEQLPSKGKFYSGRVLTRPYSFAEMSSVSDRLSLEPQDEASAYRHVLSGIEFSDGTPASSLFLGDFLFAAFYRKVISVGTNEFVVSDIIEGWKADPISVSDIEFKDIEAPALPVITRIMDEQVEFHPATTEQWLSFLLEHKKHPDVGDIITMMSDGKVNPNEVFDPDEVAVLQEVTTLLHHGMEPVQLTVTKGGTSRTLTMHLDASQSTVILPFRKSTSSKSTQIQFGKGVEAPTK